MIKLFSISVLLICNCGLLTAQESINDYFNRKGEIYFSFQTNDKSTELPILTRIISIDKVNENNLVYAYANRIQYQKLIELGYAINLLPHPGDSDPGKMATSISEMKNWDEYPSYDTYINMMNQYAQDYSDICEYVDAGETVEGRKILFLKISDNVSVNEAEPQFMYTSSMHGDELTGYVLMLRLIDSLLTSYGTDTRLTNLVDNIEIWINPLANPDGTYRGGDSTVMGAKRFNANNLDLNRNFPSPRFGDHPDGREWQPETMIMMDLAEENNFILSANFHGGVEVVNWPWDSWTGGPPDFQLHADENWWQLISWEYADTCHAYSPSDYMTFFGGATNGGDWAVIHGGRQDYMTFFQHGRELTLEISDIKLLPSSLLNQYWEYNRRSLLNYMEQLLYGIKGVITFDGKSDSVSVLVEILNHDTDDSRIFSDPVSNVYFRLIKEGIYSISFSAPGYETKIIDNVSVQDYNITLLDVELISSSVGVESGEVNLYSLMQNYPNPFNPSTKIKYSIAAQSHVMLTIYNMLGEQVARLVNQVQTAGNHEFEWIAENLTSGVYIYKLHTIALDGKSNFKSLKKLILLK